jgi:hypothetical protein
MLLSLEGAAKAKNMHMQLVVYLGIKGFFGGRFVSILHYSS